MTSSGSSGSVAVLPPLFPGYLFSSRNSVAFGDVPRLLWPGAAPDGGGSLQGACPSRMARGADVSRKKPANDYG